MGSVADSWRSLLLVKSLDSVCRDDEYYCVSLIGVRGRVSGLMEK
jgi:hypothetical protein